MRPVVLDVNIWVSAIVFSGICRSLVESLAEDKFSIALSPVLIEDLLRTIEKPKLKKLILPNFAEEILFLIHSKATIVEPKLKIKACRDADDDAVLECAVAAKANIIVTGDHDILIMNPFRNIQILSPRSFAENLGIG